MAQLDFQLIGYEITDTRSHHEDTNIWGLIVKVNGTERGLMIGKTGDVNNDPHSFEPSTLGPIEINPNDTVQAFFQMYNYGHNFHPNTGELTDILRKLTPQDPKADDPHTGSSDMKDGISVGEAIAIGKAIYETATAIFGLFADCDGIVAFDKITATGQQLIDDIKNGSATRRREINAKREQLGTPCNDSGSNYRLTWAVRDHDAHPDIPIHLHGHEAQP